MRILAILALASAAMLSASGCQYLPFGYTKLGDIAAAPAQFEGKEVKVKGAVTQITKIPLIEIKTYVLQDGTGELVVRTDGPLPAKGDTLAIRATVSSAAIIGGESVGLTLKELERLSTL
jgi:hypothetical protein